MSVDTEKETIPGEGKVWGDVGASLLPKEQHQRWPTSLEPWISQQKRQEQMGDSSPGPHPRKQFLSDVEIRLTTLHSCYP